MKIIGIIPARGGSKGIPRKNIKMIAGKPLIAWTIKAAKESRLMDDFFVSTENKEIAQISEKYHAKVIKRPAHLATDQASLLDVIKHFLKVTQADVVVLLETTNPVREKGLVDKCIRRFLDKKADSLATGYLTTIREFNGKISNRQQRKEFFYDDGNLYIITSGLIRQNRIKGRKAEEYILSKEQSIEVDEPFDFWLAEKVLEELKKDVNAFKKFKENPY